MSDKCYKCGKSVYPIELTSVNDKKFHKTCFKCSVCSMTVNMKNFLGINENGTYVIYCKTHAPKSGPSSTIGKTPSQTNLNANANSSPAPTKATTTTTKTTTTTSAPAKTSTTAPAKTSSTAPAKTTSSPAPVKSTTTSNSNNGKKEETARPSDAAKFLKRTRHIWDFESKLTEQQREDFKKLFALYDKDKSGTIDIKEMGEVLGKLGYNFSPDNLRVIWRIVDENRDGVLNFNEFLGFYDFLDFLKGLFNSADKDQSGSIDRRELNHLLKRANYKFTPEQIELLYRMCDEDGSEVLELDDFLSLILFVFWAQILFNTTDTDGDDKVDLTEFNNLLEDLMIFMHPVEVMKFFKELDTNNDGYLAFEEYIELVFELRYPLISDLVKMAIAQTGVSDELKENVNINPEDKINLMEASGFLKRSRHRFNFESKLTSKQIQDFNVLFKTYDKNGNGTIDIIELGTALSKLGYSFSPENLETIIHIVDENKDGVLNFQEFLGLYDFLEYLKLLFDTADDDKDGVISRDELKNLLERANYKFSDKQIELFYKMCDEDGSGVLEISDFFALTLFIFWAQILFAAGDTDGSDSIDLKEFNNALKRLGILMPPEGVVKYFTELDTDQNGALCFEEYMELVFMMKFIELLFG